MTKKLLYSVCFAAVLMIIILNLFCNSSHDKKNDSKQSSEYLNHSATVTYVGIEACRSCHLEIYKTFIQTGMGQSFNIATRQKSAADFSISNVVYDKYTDMNYHPFFKNDSMYVSEFRLNGKDTVYKRTERVDYIVGSGQHTNSHLTNVNGYLYQVPLTWYAQKKKWDLPPGFEKGHNVRFSRAIGIECMSCHNALPEFVEHSLNKFTSVPKGIDCERCHGPGELHVKDKLAGKLIDTSKFIDYSIVNPKKLTWQQQTDLCQRCHLQGNAVLKTNRSFSDFKPGMKLSDFIEIYMPKYKGGDDEFIMASHAQRLQQSKCFINSSVQEGQSGTKNTLTCITCHNPHVSVKATGKQVFNNACAKCHDPESSCKELLNIRSVSNDNCVGCHMQRSGTIDIPHVSVTDHWIKIPAKKETVKGIKQFAGIYCINNKQTSSESKCKAYLSYFEKFEGRDHALDSAGKYLRTLKGNESIKSRIHLLFLKNEYEQIIQTAGHISAEEVKDPWICYRIGQAFQNLQKFSDAETWYRKAIAIASENLDFANKLGASLIEQDKLAEAIEVLNSSLMKNPKQCEALTNLGFAYIRQNNIQFALECYDKALALDPDFEQALLNKAGLLNLTGKIPEAKKLLKQILKKNPENTRVKALLQSI